MSADNVLGGETVLKNFTFTLEASLLGQIFIFRKLQILSRVLVANQSAQKTLSTGLVFTHYRIQTFNSLNRTLAFIYS